MNDQNGKLPVPQPPGFPPALGFPAQAGMNQLAVAAPQVGASYLFAGPYPQPGIKREHVIPGLSRVYVTADGDLIVSQRRPTLFQAFRAKRRYDVDLTDKPTELSGEDLPTARNNFYFPYQITFTWSVQDPGSIVSRGVKDGVVVVEYAVMTRLRQITSQFAPEDWASAEARINQEFGSGLLLPEGIAISRFTTQLRIDPNLAGFLQEHAQTQSKIKIDALNRESIEAAMQRGDIGLVIEHLTRNPGATGEMIGLISRTRQASDESRKELFRMLVEKEVIQDVDLERFRELLLPPADGAGDAQRQIGQPTLTLDVNAATRLADDIKS